MPCLSDNYSWLLHEPQQGLTAVVDPAEVAPVVAALQAKGWTLTHIINSERPGGGCGVLPARPASSLCRVRLVDQGPNSSQSALLTSQSPAPQAPPPPPPQFNCTVVGPAADAARIPGIDVQLKDGER